MPFYGSNIPAGSVNEAPAGFPQTVREHRFPNAVWQQASVPADAAAMSKCTGREERRVYEVE